MIFTSHIPAYSATQTDLDADRCSAHAISKAKTRDGYRHSDSSINFG